MKLTKVKKKLIIDLTRGGKTPQEIAALLQLSKSSVYHYLQKVRKQPVKQNLSKACTLFYALLSISLLVLGWMLYVRS